MHRAEDLEQGRTEAAFYGPGPTSLSVLDYRHPNNPPRPIRRRCSKDAEEAVVHACLVRGLGIGLEKAARSHYEGHWVHMARSDERAVETREVEGHRVRLFRGSGGGGGG